MLGLLIKAWPHLHDTETEGIVEEPDQKHIGATDREPFRLRLPGFLVEEEIGLGDVLKRATYAMGIKPCGGCEKRAAAMNRWMVFTR
jgi:hypothetical protein